MHYWIYLHTLQAPCSGKALD